MPPLAACPIPRSGAGCLLRARPTPRAPSRRAATTACCTGTQRQGPPWQMWRYSRVSRLVPGSCVLLCQWRWALGEAWLALASGYWSGSTGAAVTCSPGGAQCYFLAATPACPPAFLLRRAAASDTYPHGGSRAPAGGRPSLCAGGPALASCSSGQRQQRVRGSGRSRSRRLWDARRGGGGRGSRGAGTDGVDSCDGRSGARRRRCCCCWCCSVTGAGARRRSQPSGSGGAAGKWQQQQQWQGRHPGTATGGDAGRLRLPAAQHGFGVHTPHQRAAGGGDL